MTADERLMSPPDRPGASPAARRALAICAMALVALFVPAAVIGGRSPLEVAAIPAVALLVVLTLNVWGARRATRTYDERERQIRADGVLFGLDIFVAGLALWAAATVAADRDGWAPIGVMLGLLASILVGRVAARRRAA